MLPSVSQIILIAEISQTLSTIDNIRSRLYAGGNDIDLPRKLYMVRKNVQRQYELLPSDTSLFSTSAYLYALCGKYALQAQVIIARGGGGIVVVPTGPQTSIVGIDVQFRVGVSGMVQGESVYVLNYTNIIENTVIVFLDGSDLPAGEVVQISADIVYTSTEATITFNQPVIDGQLYKIKGLRFTV